MEYTAIITEVEDGWYMGQCEQVPGQSRRVRPLKKYRKT